MPILLGTKVYRAYRKKRIWVAETYNPARCLQGLFIRWGLGGNHPGCPTLMRMQRVNPRSPDSLASPGHLHSWAAEITNGGGTTSAVC